MTLTRTPYLSTVVYVVNFTEPDAKIRFKQAEIESAFSDFVSGQSHQTNVPDHENPSHARIVFGNNSKSILFSQVSCQLQMSFSPTAISMGEQLRAVVKNVLEFSRRVEKVVPKDSLSHSGLVYDITFPSDSSVQSLQDYLFERFFKIEKLGRTASSQFNVGFEIDDLYLTLTASAYENRKMEVPVAGGAHPALVNILSIPVVAYGLQFKVDINDRPRHIDGPGSLTPPQHLLDAGERFIKTQFEKFSGLELGVTS
ncbi:hypothetical protein O3301_08470 [Janthinobacterium sp. SUN211]|uniref:hypothetical protein n=1 Tax=Janthinobacterium sp. SUN211 TaxID=3014786 RepID=UPI002713D6B0|nr:hypothetical protein [Janthinobacterium sp. SUN211]MDO8048499.1 hypothetical protein [Janthinobacterium sp. SUN211]